MRMHWSSGYSGPFHRKTPSGARGSRAVGVGTAHRVATDSGGWCPPYEILRNTETRTRAACATRIASPMTHWTQARRTTPNLGFARRGFATAALRRGLALGTLATVLLSTCFGQEKARENKEK